MILRLSGRESSLLGPVSKEAKTEKTKPTMLQTEKCFFSGHTVSTRLVANAEIVKME